MWFDGGMGQSTDAILFWGYCWTEETSAPWTIGKDDEDNGDEDWETRWARAKGLNGPTEPFPETRDDRGRQVKLSPEQSAVMEKFIAYWAEKRRLAEAAGCVVETHCSADCPMPYVAIKASLTRAWRGSPHEISGLAAEPFWQAGIDEFCAIMGIKTDNAEGGGRATWWLVSDWS